MTDETKNKETVTCHADTVRVNKLLVLPTQLPQRLAALEKAGCTVTYSLASKSGMSEVYNDVTVTGPESVVVPGWDKLQKDLGIRMENATSV